MRSKLGRGCIERGLQPFLVEVNQRLAEQFFSIRKEVMRKCKKKVSWGLEPSVFTKDLEDLIKLLIQLRGFDPEEADVQFGFDDGQGFLKLMMLVMQKPELEHANHTNKRSKYSDGICAKTFKNSSVKKCFIIGLMRAQENYANIKTMLDEVDIHGVDSTITPDMKLDLLYEGRQTGASKCNCYLCSGRAPWIGDDEGILLSIGDLFRENDR